MHAHAPRAEVLQVLQQYMDDKSAASTVETVFEMADFDHDGKLTLAEIYRCYNQHHDVVRDEQAARFEEAERKAKPLICTLARKFTDAELSSNAATGVNMSGAHIQYVLCVFQFDWTVILLLEFPDSETNSNWGLCAW